MAASRRVRIARVITLLIVGAVVGPLVLAAAAAAVSRTDPNPAAPAASGFKYNKGQAAEMLFRAYAPYRPAPGRVLTFDVQKPADWANCGYPHDLDIGSKQLTPNMLAAREMAKPSQLALDAYFTRIGLVKEDEVAVAKLDRVTSTFTAVFLRRCIESTLVRGLCVADVTARLDGDHWGAYLDNGNEGASQLRCRVLDGIAARNGLPLPDRPGASE